MKKHLDCTNYWSPTDLDPATHKPLAAKAACRSAEGNFTGNDGCVGNYTTKIAGDDSTHMMDVFEDFLGRKTKKNGAEESPFLAVIWIHTNHLPHPAMPEWYHKYNDTNGQWAGDYLGTISQMDSQVGRLRAMLKTSGAAENTMLWFTADNGAHCGSEVKDGGRNVNAAANGLRQCKASLFEGGIRVAGILEWPAMIKAHRETQVPAVVMDYIPTFLSAIGAKHPHPTWPADGIDLMPLIRDGAFAMPTRPKPIGWKLGDQSVWMDNDWKLVWKPNSGQCAMEEPYKNNTKLCVEAPCLFNLIQDPIELHDQAQAQPARYATMTKALNAFLASIEVSQVKESTCCPVDQHLLGGCKNPGPGPSPGPGPGPGPPGPPLPPQPPAAGSSIVSASAAGQCLTVLAKADHPPVVLGPCNGGSKWMVNGTVKNVAMVTGKNDGDCLKVDLQGGRSASSTSAIAKACKLGDLVTVAKCVAMDSITFNKDSGEMEATCDKEAKLCVEVDVQGGQLKLAACGSAGTKWHLK